jgi:hypothetical protein
MKQKTLLFTLIAGFSVLVLQSNDNGPAFAGTGNRSGSGTSPQASCDGSGCHAANNAATTANVGITDTTNSTNLTSYVPGKKYYLRVVGGSATLAKYGFQASVVKSSSASTQAGTLAIGGTSSAGTRISTSGGIQIFEHSSPLTATVVAGAQVYDAKCYWTAPAAGTGTVKVYGVINGVNGTGTTAGDAPNTATPVTLTEASSSVAATTNAVDFKVYPNPASNFITVTAVGIGNGACAVNVYDMRGKLLSTEAVDAVNGSLNTTINSSKWAAGLYFVQISKDNQQKVIAVEKQ